MSSLNHHRDDSFKFGGAPTLRVFQSSLPPINRPQISFLPKSLRINEGKDDDPLTEIDQNDKSIIDSFTGLSGKVNNTLTNKIENSKIYQDEVIILYLLYIKFSLLEKQRLYN